MRPPVVVTQLLRGVLESIAFALHSICGWLRFDESDAVHRSADIERLLLHHHVHASSGQIETEPRARRLMTKARDKLHEIVEPCVAFELECLLGRGDEHPLLRRGTPR